jgi:GT2 family glycosyltransferase
MAPEDTSQRLEELRRKAAAGEALDPAETAQLLEIAERLQRKAAHLRRLGEDLDRRLIAAEESLSLSAARRAGGIFRDARDRMRGWLARPKAKPIVRGAVEKREFQTAAGPYVAFYDSLGTPLPEAFERLARRIGEDGPDLVYGDEAAEWSGGRPISPVFRPDWSPELLAACMYMGRFLAISRRALDRTGSFDGLYSLARQAAASGARIGRLPEILYCAPPSGVETGAEPQPLESGPLASLIICSRSGALLARCLRGIARRTRYRPFECLVVAHRGFDDARLDAAASRFQARSTSYSGPFHFARMCNQGAREARGEFLVFVNDDVTPLSPDWLGHLAAHALRREIGAAGAKLLYPSGAIQHAGVAIGIVDGAGHPGRGTLGRPWWPWLDFTRDVSAVTGACLAIRTAVFREAGGFSEDFPVNYNDVDLCLRLRRAGYRVVVEPRALLRHDECRSRPGRTTAGERELFYDLWGGQIEAGDPFYHPALPLDREDLAFAD